MTVATSEDLVDRVKQAARAEGWSGTRAMNGFSRWLNWTGKRNEAPLPVRAETLMRFLLEHAADGVPVSELRALNESISFCHGKAHAGISPHVVEDTAWRAFTTAMMAGATGPGVTPPSDIKLARKALERADARGNP
jgi:hypothetical protein